jgi:hypothetical protein
MREALSNGLKMEKRTLPVVDEDVEPNDDVMKRLLDQMVNDVLPRATKAPDAGEALDANADPSGTYDRIKRLRGITQRSSRVQKKRSPAFCSPGFAR